MVPSSESTADTRKSLADRPHRLMVAGVNLPGIRAGNLAEQRARMDADVVRRTIAPAAGPLMALRWVQVLDQRAALTHVENLKTAADRQHRQIPRQRLFE